MTRAFLSTEAMSRFSQARIDVVGRLGALAQEHEAQFIVVAGDVFESNQLSRVTLTRALDALSSLPVPIYLLPGNHDPLDGSSIFNTREFHEVGGSVFVLRDTSPAAVPGVDGVEIYGAPWPTKHPSSDLCGDLLESLPSADDALRIVVAHGQVDELSPDQSRPEIIDLAKVEAALDSGLVQYVALGDRHSLTQVGRTGRVWYSGAPLVTAFDEVEPNTALLVEIESGGDCSTRALEVGQWEFIAEHFVVNGAEDIDRFRAWLDGLPNKQRTAIKVGFEGSVNLAEDAMLAELMDSRADLFASLRKRERTSDLVTVPDRLDQNSLDLAGYAKSAWDELVAKTQQGNEVAQDALKLLYRLSRREAP